MRKTLLLFFIPLFLLISSCTKSPTGRNQFMIVSPEMAINSSKLAYVQTLKPLAQEGKIDKDPRVTKRVRHITGKLIAQAIRLFPNSRNWEWDVTVIDEPDMVNAWCMAGGKMAIYTGLLNKVNPTDDELAQVIGHEISHALANHTAERMSIAMASQLGILGVAMASQDSSSQGAILAGSAAAASLAVSMPNSRTAEKEADVMGLEIAARAGYNPYAASSLWKKMAKVGKAAPPEFLSTHPSPGNRQQELNRMAGKMMPYYLNKSRKPVYRFKNPPAY